jgi:hypothetical protein
MLVGRDFQEVCKEGCEAARKCRALQPRDGRALRPYRQTLPASRRSDIYAMCFAIMTCGATCIFIFRSARLLHKQKAGAGCARLGKGTDLALSG